MHRNPLFSNISWANLELRAISNVLSQHPESSVDRVDDLADVIQEIPQDAKDFTKEKSTQIRTELESSDAEFKLTRRLNDLRHAHELSRKAEAKERAAIEAKHAALAEKRQEGIAEVRRQLRVIARAKKVAGIK